MANRNLVDVNTGDPTTEGRLQMYLVLGTLACADMERMQAFKDHKIAIAGRSAMYDPNVFDPATFRTRARAALEGAGFSRGFVDAILWENFTEEVWRALKVLRSNLILLQDAYNAPDCPCVSVIVAQAIAAENLLEPLRKVNRATEIALPQKN